MFLSDNLEGLFDQVLHGDKYQYLKLGIKDEFNSPDVRVVHKKSRVSGGDTSDFGMQGKRLQHIENLDGKNLYLGIQTLNATDLEQHQGTSKDWQFSPDSDAFSNAQDGQASFEI